MAENDAKDESKAGRKDFWKIYSEVHKQLKALEGKDDQQSNEHRENLLEELMCMDMALGPYRRAMGQAPRKSQTDNTGNDAN